MASGTKMQNNKDKKKILKSARKKGHITHQTGQTESKLHNDNNGIYNTYLMEPMKKK